MGQKIPLRITQDRYQDSIFSRIIGMKRYISENPSQFPLLVKATKLWDDAIVRFPSEHTDELIALTEALEELTNQHQMIAYEQGLMDGGYMLGQLNQLVIAEGECA